jgi:hypothetical protein
MPSKRSGLSGPIITVDPKVSLACGKSSSFHFMSLLGHSHSLPRLVGCRALLLLLFSLAPPRVPSLFFPALLSHSFAWWPTLGHPS